MNLDDLTIEEVRAIQITDIRARLAARTREPDEGELWVES
jgi:hypothetical protein